MIKRLVISFLLFCGVFLGSTRAQAFWVWTPETNKFVNPKYAVKEVPSEQLSFALDFFSVNQYKQAIQELEKLIKHYPKAREASEAQYYIGLSYEKMDRPETAYKEYQKVIDTYPFSERSAEIVKRQYDIGSLLMDGKMNPKNRFLDSLSGTDYDIIEIFRSVIKNAPYSEWAAPSQYKIGLYLMEKELYQEARDEFEMVINDYPDSEWARAAQYQIALTDSKRSTDAEYDQKVTKAAVDGFNDFLETYPDAQLSEDAKVEIAKLRDKEAKNSFVIAQFYEKQKNYNAAKIYYQGIVSKYSGTEWATKALKRIRVISEMGNK